MRTVASPNICNSLMGMEYWIIVDNRHAGPYTATQLVAAGLLPDTLVWHEGLTDWIPAGEVTELAAMIAVRDNSDNSADNSVGAQADAGTPSTEAADDAAQCPQQATESFSGDFNSSPGVPQPASAPRWQQPQEAAPAPAPAPVMSEPCPPSYIAWSVIATVICCIPLGIPAIVYSSMVKSAYYKGDIAKARRYSNLAQWFIILAITFGAVSWPFQIAFSF